MLYECVCGQYQTLELGNLVIRTRYKKKNFVSISMHTGETSFPKKRIVGELSQFPNGKQRKQSLSYYRHTEPHIWRQRADSTHPYCGAVEIKKGKEGERFLGNTSSKKPVERASIYVEKSKNIKRDEESDELSEWYVGPSSANPANKINRTYKTNKEKIQHGSFTKITSHQVQASSNNKPQN